MFTKAYVQGDWRAAPACVRGGVEMDETMHKNFYDFLGKLESYNIKNVATWHKSAEGTLDMASDTDGERNERECDSADCVITYAQGERPNNRHWGSLWYISRAVAHKKRCIVIADASCCIWQHHAMRNKAIKRYSNPEEFFNELTLHKRKK